MATTVIHIREWDRSNPDHVYIGRGSPYGNPFVIGTDGDREDVIRLFEVYVGERPELRKLIKRRLKDKTLVCYCKPKACHGDVCAEIADED